MTASTRVKKVLHIGCVHPSRSNRLALQLRYAAPSLRTQVIHLSGKTPGYRHESNFCADIRFVPNWPARSDDVYLIRRAKSLVRRSLNALKVIGWLWSSDADLLHAHENSSLWALALWVAVFRRPAVWDPHDYFHERLRLRSRFGRLNRKEILERIIVRRNTQILVVSTGMEERFAGMYPRARVRTIKNYSADRDSFGDTRTATVPTPESLVAIRKELASGKIRLVYPGLIKPERIELALIEVLGKIPGIELDIYGIDRSETYQARIEATLANEKIDNIRLMGAYSCENVVSILADYHYALFPFPVTNENLDFCLPNKFFQCIEARLPMITTDMKEMGGIINQFGLGFVFPSGDNASCAEFLRNCCVSGDDYLARVSRILTYQATELDYRQQQSVLLDTYFAAIERR